MGSPERDVFTELFWRIRNLQYVPGEDEMKALKKCELAAYRSAGVASSLVGASFMALNVATGVYKRRKGATIGVSVCVAAAAGYYGAKWTSPYCLETLAQLESPMGGELAIILARRCPNCAAAKLSPWSSAIVAAGQAADGWSDKPEEDLDITPRIATPDALAVLRERRRKAYQDIHMRNLRAEQAAAGIAPGVDSGDGDGSPPPPAVKEVAERALQRSGSAAARDSGFFASVFGSSMDTGSEGQADNRPGGQPPQAAGRPRRRRHALANSEAVPQHGLSDSQLPAEAPAPDQPVRRRRRQLAAGAVEPELADPWASDGAQQAASR
mmetsp:Transcript_38357/g.108414  ORF Transcript_38357/g.108414 Transcript_38357/m.108414 type:complete len:326 (+) Transcript_38357:133-1110(+)